MPGWKLVVKMIEREEHISADGQLVLIVADANDGDVQIGFRGFTWHTHADILAALARLPEHDAVRIYVDDILQDQSIIAVQSIDGVPHDAWVTDDPVGDCKYQQANETIHFRYWSGCLYVK